MILILITFLDVKINRELIFNDFNGNAIDIQFIDEPLYLEKVMQLTERVIKWWHDPLTLWRKAINQLLFGAN